MRRTVCCAVAAATSVSVLATANATASTPSPDEARAKGNARVVLAPKMVNKLNRANISVKALKPAKATKFKGHPTVRFPVAKRAKKVVRLRGGLAFVKGSKRATAGRLRGNYKIGRVSARINGSKRRFVFNARKSSYPRFGNVRLVLTRYAAGSLNATFNTKQFDRGDTFGYARVRR